MTLTYHYWFEKSYFVDTHMRIELEVGLRSCKAKMEWILMNCSDENVSHKARRNALARRWPDQTN